MTLEGGKGIQEAIWIRFKKSLMEAHLFLSYTGFMKNICYYPMSLPISKTTLAM